MSPEYEKTDRSLVGWFHQKSWCLLVRSQMSLRRQALAAFGTPCIQHFAATNSCHPRTETVTTFTNEYTWLESPFHLLYSSYTAAPDILLLTRLS